MSCSTPYDPIGVYLTGVVPNAYIPCSNRPYREDVLDAHVFAAVDKPRQLTADWLADYNTNRYHQVLQGSYLVNMPRNVTFSY